MNINRIDLGPVTVLRMEGDIDDRGANDLRTSLLDCLKDKRYNVIGNLEKLLQHPDPEVREAAEDAIDYLEE